MIKGISISPDMRNGLLGGLAFVAVIYGVLVFSTMIRSASYVEKMEERLASEMLEIHYPAPVPVINFNVDDIDQTVESGSGIPSPIEALLQDHEYGLLPQRTLKMTPFQAYQAPFDTAGLTGPYISLMFADYGLSDSTSEFALKNLPKEISFILSPYVNAPEPWQDFARQTGHELWLQLYFENEDYPRIDTGQLTFLKRSSLRLNMDQLSKVMGLAEGYVGLVGHLDPVLSGIKPLMKNMFGEIFNRGLGYIETGESREVIETIAANYNAPYMKGAITVSSAADLKKLSDMARQNKRAVGVINASPQFLRRDLPRWIAGLRDEGIMLVPASALYRL